MTESPSVGYEVDSNGHFCVAWNSYEKYVVFDAVDLRNGAWTHVTAVRDVAKDSFLLYVNGRLAQEKKVGAGQDIEEFYYHHAIGGDFLSRQKEKRQFKGSIRQVTIYSDALTSGEISRDYRNGNTISGSKRTDLILNVQLDASMVVAKDTSSFANDAYLASNDYFYEDELYEAKDYSFAVLPDIQMITLFYPEMVSTIPQYLLNNESKQKIEAVFTVGDLTNGQHSKGSSFDKQYKVIRDQFAKLDGHMPYMFVPGNHDYDDECKTNRNLTYLNKYLTIEKHSKWAEWGGSFSNDSIINSYYLLEYAGVKYIVFAMDFGMSDEALEWACSVTEQHLDRRLIMLTHGHLNPDGRLIKSHDYGFASKVSVNSAEQVWDKWLRKYPNVFMTFCGHVISDDIVITEQVGDNGNVVANFLINAQGIIMNDGLEAMVALLNFDEANGLVYVNYVSAIQNKLYDIQNQFVYDFKGNTGIMSSKYKQASAQTLTKEQTINHAVKRTSLITTSQSVNIKPTAENNGYTLAILIAGGFSVIVAAALTRKSRRAKHEEK
jgi:calcineurin-like phosphoesterase family protein